jgi:hypothetical protein
VALCYSLHSASCSKLKIGYSVIRNDHRHGNATRCMQDEGNSQVPNNVRENISKCKLSYKIQQTFKSEP